MLRLRGKQIIIGDRADTGRATTIEALEARTLLSLSANQLFPTDSPWNHPITDAPVAANSATLVSSIGATKPLHPDFGSGLYAGANIGIPYNVVPGTQATVNVVIDAYASQSDIVPVPIPANAIIEGDPLTGTANNGDRHLIVYDKDHNVAYELFNTHHPSEEADNQWHADSEAVWNMAADSFRTPGYTSADAAGLPILPGLVRADEVLTQGVINHALRFTVPASDAAYVFPASHEAGSNNPALPRMGERFRLKQSFDISGYSPANQVILQALKSYGMIVADNGSSWFLSGSPDAGWNNDDLHALTSVIGSNFEAVDLTPVVSSLDHSSGAPGTALAVQGVNFMGVAGNLQVTVGGVAATNVTVLSDNTLTVTVPAHAAATTDVVVTTPYGLSAVSAADQFTYVTTAGPALLSTTIDDGSAQRSEVRSLTFAFSAPVSLAAGAITLSLSNAAGSGSGTNDGSAPSDASSALGTPASSDGGLTWVVPIVATSAFSSFGSLTDGVYTATIHAALVTDVFNQHLAGGDQTKVFHRLYGDNNGDKRVNSLDYGMFTAAFGSSSITANYNGNFDFNHDGRVNSLDYGQFAARFGKSVSYVG
ncbi:MAG TPA: IPT/TIG domain-containing protein [Tepidisphaeraceae bacterium]|jgi:hypothetical protein|nr:IPT/TIG domain-containing protein [Tepidisphaeraceae bacterium]